MGVIENTFREMDRIRRRGAALRRARILVGASVEELAQFSKVDADALTAAEQGWKGLDDRETTAVECALISLLEEHARNAV